MDWILGFIDDSRALVYGLPWDQIKAGLPQFLWFLTLVAMFGCLLRLRTIRDIIREFNQARGPIWDLRETVKQIDDLKGTVQQIEGLKPVIEKMQQQIGGLSPAIQQMDDQIARLEATAAATRKQMAEWQIESVSERTQAEPDPGNPVPESTAPTVDAATDDSTNWDILRDIWRRNTDRIEYLIDQIKDGRTRQSFDRLPRTNYNKIINKLEFRGLLSKGAAEASRELNAIFNAYRPRNNRVRSEMLGPLYVLDSQLDREIVPYAQVQGIGDGDSDSSAPSATPPLSRSPLSPSPQAAPAQRGHLNGGVDAQVSAGDRVS